MAALDDLIQQRAALVAQITGSARVETPQLGAVEFRSADDLRKALALIDAQIAALSGGPATGTVVLQADRGFSS